MLKLFVWRRLPGRFVFLMVLVWGAFGSGGPVAMALAGNVYYVAAADPGAEDSNDGLAPEYEGGTTGPWRTIHRALSAMGPGDTVLVRAGTYYEAGLEFADSGRTDTPITLAAYEDEEVVIDGSQASGALSGILIKSGQGHLVIQGLIIQNMPDCGISTQEDSQALHQDLSILNCKLRNNGWSGLRLAAVDGFVVENVEAHSNGFYGLNIISSEDGGLSSANGVVRGSVFHDHIGPEGHGLAINQAHHITVVNCVAYHNLIHGFDISDWPKGEPVSHDIVFQGNSSYDNGVAGFSVNSDSHHVLYLGNAAYRNGADWAGRGSASGFWCYEGCWQVEWSNNLAAANSDAGFFVEDQAGTYAGYENTAVIYRNNISYLNGRDDWDERLGLRIIGSGWQVVSQNNNWAGVPGAEVYVVEIDMEEQPHLLLTAEQVNAGLFQSGERSIDPGFLDPAQEDWRLASDSPMIDAGLDLGYPFCGLAPDLGPHEYCP
jgi:hypothetical protein